MEEIQRKTEDMVNLLTGADSHQKSLDERIAQTPVENVSWSGERGRSFCRPNEKEYQDLLKEFGQDGVNYDRAGEPDFSPFETAHVKISDMGVERSKNFSAAGKKLLQSEWAKENDIYSLSDLNAYMSEHHLTWHECSDGVTMRLVPSAINHRFGHSGGVAEMGSLDDRLLFSGDGIVRTGGKAAGRINIQVNKAVVKTEDSLHSAVDGVTETVSRASESVEDFFSQYFDTEALKELNKAGMDAATSAAVMSGIISIVQNTKRVAGDKEDANEAVKNVVRDVGSSAMVAYATGAVSHIITKNFGEILTENGAAMVAVGAVQVSKQVISYATGEISQDQFYENVTETAAYMMSAYIGKSVGKNVGALIGAAIGEAILPVIGAEIGAAAGRMIGQIVGEMIATIVCSEIISTIRFSKEFKKKNEKIKSLCRDAEREIVASQERIRNIIQEENSEFRIIIDSGYEQILTGIRRNSCEQIETGVENIGSLFGLSRDDFAKYKISRGNLFERKVFVIE